MASAFRTGSRMHRFWWFCDGRWAWADRPSEDHRPGCAYTDPDQGRDWIDESGKACHASASCNCGRRLAYYAHWWCRPLLAIVGSGWFLRLVFCRWWWHASVDDQCGMPAHRFCVRCNTATPDAELCE